MQKQVDQLVNSAEKFQEGSVNFARFLHQKLVEEGEDVRDLADAMHGKQLGHPLHPVLTDVTIGSWTLAFIFDIMGIVSGSARDAADKLTMLGIISSVPTALTGMVDYSAIKRDAASYGAAHGILNTLALSCYVRSAVARMRGNRNKALVYSIMGVMIVSASAWLGGDLVYRHRIGVNHVPDAEINEWTEVMPLENLPEGVPTRVDVDGVPVLLFRQDEEVSAINAVCSHAGGPLEGGRVVKGVCVECPWHQSVFDMRNGYVVHSPAVYDQPQYAVRIVDEQIEVRQVGD